MPHRGSHQHCVPPRPSAKRPWNLRHLRDEGDTAGLITAYYEGAAAASHGLSLKSQTPPDLTHSTSDECDADHEASVATHAPAFTMRTAA